MDERLPIGIEGTPITAGRPLSKIGIIILAFIIVSACVFIYYYSPKLYEPESEKQKITATFNDVYLNQTADSDEDGRYDYLNISVGVNVSESGEYKVDGLLYINNNTMYAFSTVHLSIGNNQAITLSFNGLDIYLCRSNGSYQLRDLTLRIIKGNTSFRMDYREYAYNTSFYNYTDFQRSVHIEEKGKIVGSSSDLPDLNNPNDPYIYTIAARAFDVKETAAMVTVRVDYDISKVGPRDSWIDLYIYCDEENESSESKTGNDGYTYKIITLNSERITEIGYGKWVGLIHHCNDPGVISTTGNTASYTLTIDVVYE
ncbi:MAG: hypothetical protein L6265_10275 [Thermoplasmatales archaeon]|nr:hypothetical protein [Candidatus Thermoplasmatota archaeon]MCG2826962.1 hypothetical protein [Thermoplasmatales archaeon]